MSKSKINFNIKTNLNRKGRDAKLGIKSKKVNFKPKSYRFTNEDIILLNNLKKKLNDVVRIKISHTKVLQILLHYSQNISEDELIDCLKQMVCK